MDKICEKSIIVTVSKIIKIHDQSENNATYQLFPLKKLIQINRNIDLSQLFQDLTNQVFIFTVRTISI